MALQRHEATASWVPSPSAPSLPVTFENGADFPPDGNAAVPVVLAQRQLHVEEWDAPEDGHDGVGEEERS